MGLYRGLAVGSEILAVVLGSLVLLAGTEWPSTWPASCGVICALGFYGLRRRADRRNVVAGCARRADEGAGITVRRRDGGPTCIAAPSLGRYGSLLRCSRPRERVSHHGPCHAQSAFPAVRCVVMALETGGDGAAPVSTFLEVI